MRSLPILLTFLVATAWFNLVVVVEGRNFHRIIKDDVEDMLMKRDDIYFGGEQGNNDLKLTEKDLPKNGELFEGDMVMDNEIRRFVLGMNNKRSAVMLADEGERKHWPHGIVPYEFDENILPIIKSRIQQAIKHFNDYTCIRYIPKRKTDKDYVHFISDGKGCSSSVGRVGGQQKIHLSRGCKRIGTVMHEMMHAIGIVHEQSRPDRDKHLKVAFENIKKAASHNFAKYQWYNTDNLHVEYNFFSVMHYSNYAFSSNGKKTLIAKNDDQLKFGQRKWLTRSDVRQIDTLYNCKGVKYDPDTLLDDMTDDDVMEQKRDREEKRDWERKELALL